MKKATAIALIAFTIISISAQSTTASSEAQLRQISSKIQGIQGNLIRLTAAIDRLNETLTRIADNMPQGNNGNHGENKTLKESSDEQE